MKTNLLKIATGLFLFALTANNVNAQSINVKEFFDYPVGSIINQNGGIGWITPFSWKNGTKTPVLSNGQVVLGSLTGNTVGNKLTVSDATPTGTGDFPSRSFTDITNVASKVIWFSWDFQQSAPGATFAGLSFFFNNQEGLYVGRNDFDLVGTCCAFPNETFHPDDMYFPSGLVTVLDKHFYLLKVTFLGNSRIRADVWADYLGSTEPTVESAKFQYTAFRNESLGGFNNFKFSSFAQQSFATFDAIQFSDSYANVFRESPLLPLTNVVLKASSVANGNFISWTSETQINVASLAVERKDASGAWVNISGALAANASSYVDNNPLAGDNYYQLVSKDTDGSTKSYGPAFVAGLVVDATTFYPNPVTGGELNVDAGNQAINSVSIFDLLGKRVSFNNNNGSSSKVTVNTLSLKKGVYILEVNGQKSTSRNKVVIN